jgi:hypothetical protein
MGWWSSVVGAVRSALAPRRAAPAPVPAGQLASVDALVAGLEDVGAGLEADDGLVAFNTMYLKVTKLVRDRITEGWFHDSAYLTRLDVVFGGMYLEAVDAATPNPSWAPVLECRDLPGRLPIQFALAGMNAHINHDLAVAVVESCRQLGRSPSSPGIEEDYQRITQLLAEVQEEVRQSFLAGPALQLDRRYAAPLANLVGSWSIGRARDAAWTNALVLWSLDETANLRADFLDQLSRTVGMAGRLLLTPLDELT